jgi:hypothetical protein
LRYDVGPATLNPYDAMTVALFVLTVLMTIYVLGLRQPR